jgi:redox-sensitive bicupin YhaK (pirin superfamily)
MSSQPDEQLKRRDVLRMAVATVGAAALTQCTQAATVPLEPNAQPKLLQGLSLSEGSSLKVQRLFPLAAGHHQDPFVLFDHVAAPPHAVVPMHPHRGFEAFTYIFDGMNRHQDTLGNDSAVSSGGAQVFTSGRGAAHSERLLGSTGGNGIQLWVNLPPALKQMKPSYQAVQPQDIPETHERGVTVRTVVGPGSPTVLQTEVRWLDLVLEPGAAFEEAITAGWSALLYVVQGHVRIGEREFAQGQAALPQTGAFTVKALVASRVMFLSGVPHRQPIQQHGPFVD